MLASRRSQPVRFGAIAAALLLVGATGCGGGDSSDDTTSQGAAPSATGHAGAREIEACLKKAGQAVDPQKSKPSGPTVLSLPLAGNGTFALVEVYDSAEAAAMAASRFAGFFRPRGGNTETKGNVLLGYNARALTKNQRKPIEACL